jgi:hypothetical protein
MRAVRRSHEERMKAKARNLLRVWRRLHPCEPDPREVGRLASTHGRPCSCWLCRNGADETLTMRERRFDDPELI